MSLSSEEIAKLQKDLEESKAAQAKAAEDLENEKTMREATQRLLDNQDLLQRRKQEATRVQESTQRTVAEGEQALVASVDAILNKFTPEDFSDPDKLRAMMREFGTQVTKIAYTEATGRTLKTVSDIVKTTASIQDITNKWRRDNPDLVPHEDMVEFYYEKHTNQDDSVAVRIESASKQVREKLGLEREKGKSEARSSSGNVQRTRVMTPSKSDGEDSSQVTEEKTPTLSDDEKREDLGNFLNTRRKLQQKKSSTRY
jgi:hypothetical protein